MRKIALVILCLLFFVVGCAVDTPISDLGAVEESAEILASDVASLDAQFCAEEEAAVGISGLRMIGCWCDSSLRCCSFDDPFLGFWVTCIHAPTVCEAAIECPPGKFCDW